MSEAEQVSFNSVLVANRGEIACRIIRSVKGLGLKAISIYSDADKNAPHVAIADDAVSIGPAAASESYLNIEKIILACKKTGATAVHPGYGFLSENAEFSKRCLDEGIVFIGPTPEAIELMGDKALAKRRMIDAGVPCIPGYQGDNQNDDAFIEASNEIGFPIMVKAAAGGGGRGMRLVSDPSNLKSAIRDARSEAENAFGAGHLILEKAIVEPRHVEIQILSDRFGNHIHLGERDCSVQRRHQKVIEEAPCPIMTSALRMKMGETAIAAAKDISYVGAGTLEFLLDKDGNFFFLEMNTRLQVEHPVTEAVTDVDLVEQQILIAQGKPMSYTQDDIVYRGHAIEARLYAEDTNNDFLPASGKIAHWKKPTGPGIRVDSGIEKGSEVSPYYDPMLAKIIAHGNSRDEARNKLISALSRSVLFGITTNRKFLIEALEQEAFANGEATTSFISDHFSNKTSVPAGLDHEAIIASAVILFAVEQDEIAQKANIPSGSLLDWASASTISKEFRLVFNSEEIKISLTPRSLSKYTATLNGKEYETGLKSIDIDTALLTFNERRRSIPFNIEYDAHGKKQIHLLYLHNDYTFSIAGSGSKTNIAAEGIGKITAPMHGVVLEISLDTGASVKKGDRVAVLEAMKMQHELVADMDGEIASVGVAEGTQVSIDTVILEIVPSDGEAD